MAAYEKPQSEWQARFKCPCPGLTCTQVEKVSIIRTKWDHDIWPYFWVMQNDVGLWPGTDSDEWIEVVW